MTPCVQVAGLNTSSALAAFEKMEDKVLAMESEAEAAMQVSNVLGSGEGCAKVLLSGARWTNRAVMQGRHGINIAHHSPEPISI